MVEKRSTGWAGRSGGLDDSTKSFFSSSQTLSQLPNSSPKDAKGKRIQYPSDNRPRSLLKPGIAVAYIYASVVLLVWNLWPEKHQTLQTDPVEAVALEETKVTKDIAVITGDDKDGRVERVEPGSTGSTGSTRSTGSAASAASNIEVPLKPFKPLSPTAAQQTMTQTAIRSQSLIADVTPRLKAGQFVQPADSLRFDSTGRTFEAVGDHLQASWGWMYQGTSGLVGDQRKQEATSGFIPKALKALGSNIAWQSLFEISFATGEKVTSLDCYLVKGAPLSQVEAEKWKLIAGEAIELQCPKSLTVQWTGALLRLAGGAEALRIRVLYSSKEADSPPVPVSLTTWDFNETSFACSGGDCLGTSGEVDGSPLIDPKRGLWVAMEHPRAVHGLRRNGTRVVAELFYPSPGVPYYASLGVSSAGRTGPSVDAADSFFLLRRHFRAYLDQVRASPVRPFLHYTTWYDLRRHPCIDSTALGLPHCSAAKTLNEQNVDQRIQEIYTELSDRGVRLMGTLLDDGWDDAGMPWHVEHTNFPSGLSAISVAKNKGVSLGVWMSPSGGFGEGGKRRVKTGAAMGLEFHGDVNTLSTPSSLRLSGTRYFDWFFNASLNLVENGITFFKFDGIGAIGAGKSSGAVDAEDVDRLIFLANHLRHRDSQRQSSGTSAMGERFQASAVTGVWPSPWWLCSMDFVWRGGPDLGRKGVGSPRQQWITFRDSMVHDLSRRAQLCPLSSLSVGGIVWSRAEEPGAYLNSFDMEGFAQEVQSFFLSGVMHQDLQIQPALLAPAYWDILGSYINISTKYADVLRDSHWMGGDPSQGEVYGYGAYACPPCLGLMTWRNPGAERQNTTFTLRKALSLPQAWPGGSVGGRWHVRIIAESEVTFDASQLDFTWEAVLLDQPLHLQLESLQLRSFKASRIFNPVFVRWSKRKYDVDSGLKSLWTNCWQHKLQNVMELAAEAGAKPKALSHCGVVQVPQQQNGTESRKQQKARVLLRPLWPHELQPQRWVTPEISGFGRPLLDQHTEVADHAALSQT